MAHYDADSEAYFDDEDDWESDTVLSLHEEGNLDAPLPDTLDLPAEHFSDVDDSDYSLDYEYLGPRHPVYRDQDDADSDASELSDSLAEYATRSTSFDMWDEDPYSTNDFTWDANDMRLTLFIKAKHHDLQLWNQPSFWRKEKGWPRQLPSSGSTTNHDQSANALCLVLSDLGVTEHLYAVYRDRIVECGQVTASRRPRNSAKVAARQETTWIDSDITYASAVASADGSKFCETHISVSLPRAIPLSANRHHQFSPEHPDCISRCVPFTKYIKRSDFPPIYAQDAYVALDFEPLCLEQKYGYMAIGGIEGEFELYCCMDRDKPIKIWGTKFKGKNNVMLMTNSVHIVRWQKLDSRAKPAAAAANSESESESEHDAEYEYMLIACMNAAGILVYRLPSHQQCRDKSTMTVKLHQHLRCFDQVPINNAKISPNGQQMVCVGDEGYVFVFDIHQDQGGRVSFSAPAKLPIPLSLLHSSEGNGDVPYSSQYVAWSNSSTYFAHTSDTHNTVLVWRASTREILYAIDAAGYTYAIEFHPHFEGVLTFTNRYGYFHTVNLEEAMDRHDYTKRLSIFAFDKQTTTSRGHACNDACLTQKVPDHPAYHTRHLNAKHEITMVSFRGEKDRRLRILAKINGIQWSKDGRYLYVSTKKRVLAYEFMPCAKSVTSLFDVAGKTTREMLERSVHGQKRRRRGEDGYADDEILPLVTKKFVSIPKHVRHRVVNQTKFASHD